MTRTTHIQVRLTPEEKGRLRFEAGDKSLSDYIRSKVFPEPRKASEKHSDLTGSERLVFEVLVKQLVTQGLTTPAAKVQAAKELILSRSSG